MNNYLVSKIIFNHEFLFDITGSIFFKKYKTLILADLHLGKGISLNDAGNIIPLYDFNETIENLRKIIKKYNPSTIISLGDSFHNNNTLLNMTEEQINNVKELTSKIRFIWINGNHDHDLCDKEKIGGEFCNDLKFRKFTFRHIKTSKITDQFEFSGHYHPKTYLKINKTKYYYKCFVVGKNFCILPSFGHYTGGIDIKSKKLKSQIDRNVQVLILGKRKIIQFDF